MYYVLSPVLANHKKRYILLPSSARGHNPLKLEGLLQAILASCRFKPRPVKLYNSSDGTLEKAWGLEISRSIKASLRSIEADDPY
jgi:hypothetical protein